MKPAALGFRVHSGWCVLAAISLEEGLPRLLLHERPHLIESFTFEFRQPYHTAKKKPLDAGREFIAQIRAEARRLASEATHSASKNLADQGHEIKFCGLLAASGKTLPELPQILASHALIHTADGELFRDVVLHACEHCNLLPFTVKEKEVLERVGKASHMSPKELGVRLVDLGRTCGSPWTQDEKLAAAAAWLAALQSDTPPRHSTSASN